MWGNWQEDTPTACTRSSKKVFSVLLRITALKGGEITGAAVPHGGVLLRLLRGSMTTSSAVIHTKLYVVFSAAMVLKCGINSVAIVDFGT